MTLPRSVWQPSYTLTPVIARHLMEIEATRAVKEYTHFLSARFAYRRVIGDVGIVDPKGKMSKPNVEETLETLPSLSSSCSSRSWPTTLLSRPLVSEASVSEFGIALE